MIPSARASKSAGARSRNRSEPSARKAATASSSMGSSRVIRDGSTLSGRTSAVTARTKPTFTMQEPTMLPKASAVSPRDADIPFTTSSGVEVPKATTVMPITRGGTPSAPARRAMPSTKYFAEVSSSASPPRKSAAFIQRSALRNKAGLRSRSWILQVSRGPAGQFAPWAIDPRGARRADCGRRLTGDTLVPACHCSAGDRC